MKNIFVLKLNVLKYKKKSKFRINNKKFLLSLMQFWQYYV